MYSTPGLNEATVGTTRRTGSVFVEPQWRTARHKAFVDAVPPELSERYEIAYVIGEGASSVVYRARQWGMDCPVAIKCLEPASQTSSGAVDTLLREARFLARAQHQNVVEVYDFGRGIEGAWLVMELVDGESLDQRRSRMGRLSWPSVRRIMRDLGAAVAHSHEMGVIHNDIKPHNCMWIRTDDHAGCVKLLDYGIASAVRDGEEDLAQWGVSGTPAYMAPERMTEPGSVQSDIYSLGAVMYELLTGSLPFSATSSVSVMMEHAHKSLELPSLRTPGCCSAEVDGVIAKAMAKSTSERFDSVAEFVRDLESADFMADELGESVADRMVLAANPEPTADEETIATQATRHFRFEKRGAHPPTFRRTPIGA